MAVYAKQVLDVTLPAAADYTGSQYYFVKTDSAGRAAVCSGTADEPTGILQNKPNAIDRPAQVRVIGVSKLVAGAAIAIAVSVSTDATGKGVTSVTGQYKSGKAAAASAAANGVIETYVQCVNAPLV